MPDSDSLRDLFTASARDRGEQYFWNGRVYDLHRRAGVWYANVSGSGSGSQPHRAQIDQSAFVARGREQRDLVHCSCQAFRNLGPCKHLWAMLIGIELATAASDTPEVEVCTPHSAPAVATAPHSATLAAASGLERARAIAHARRAPYAAPAAGAIELGYAVAAEDDRLRVVVLARRRPNGLRNTAKWQLFSEVGATDRALPAEDARLLQILRGMVPLWQGFDPLGYSVECEVPAAAIEVVAPLLARHPRAHWHDHRSGDLEDFTTAPRFRWRDGPPPRFMARLRRENGNAILEPALLPADAPPADAPPGDAPTGDAPAGDTPPGDTPPDHTDATAASEQRQLWVDGDELMQIDVGPAGGLSGALRAEGPLVVAADEAHHLLQELGRVPDGARILADEVLDDDCPPQPQLHIVSPERAKPRHVDARCRFRYGEQVLDHDDQRSLVPTTDGTLLRRNHAAEAAFVARLDEFGLTPDGHSGDWKLRANELHRIVTRLLDADVEVLADGKPMSSAALPHLHVRSGVDWFELHGEVAFGTASAPLPAVLAALRAGERTVSLGDGSLGLLPEKWLEGWERALDLGKTAGDAVRFTRAQAWVIEALLAAQQAELDVDDDFAALRQRLHDFRGVRPVSPPRGFRGTLRPYQREGLGWLHFLCELQLGGCLADDMGLGKTVQVLALLLARRREAGGQPALVVAPRSLVFNWAREAARFTPRLGVLEFTGPTRWADLGADEALEEEAFEDENEWLVDAFTAFDLVLTTYGTLRRDIVKLRHVPFDHVVLDEAQQIKNAQSQTAKAARVLQARHRLVLSGTPIENHLDELWSLFEFLNPGMLGRAPAFRRLVAKGGDGGARIGPQLRSALRPFLLRRTKEEVLADLPEKTEQVVEVELRGGQRRFYDELRDSVRGSLLDDVAARGIDKMRIQVLQALLRLRQAACHPALIDGAHRDLGSAKLDTLLPRLEEVIDGGHKALVFSQFPTLLRHVREWLDANGHAYAYLDGRTRKRQERVDRFQNDPSCPLFLISLKAGGHGLNLTAADYVFLLDPWWNPAAEAQAIDRAHRIGQQKPVSVYRLIARDTVEQKVLELQDRKRELAASLFEGGKSASLRDLTREDLEGLLG